MRRIVITLAAAIVSVLADAGTAAPVGDAGNSTKRGRCQDRTGKAT
jgi:hypothetical protein